MEPEEDNSPKIYEKESMRFISNKIINEENDLNQDAEELEKFIKIHFRFLHQQLFLQA